MAKQVRVKVNPKGVRELLQGKGKNNRIREDLDKRMNRVESRMKSNPAMKGVTVNRQTYVGHDRVRASAGIPAGLEARSGIASRALDAAGGG